MPNRMIRFTTSRSGFNPHGLRFVEGEPDPSDKGGQNDPPADAPADPPDEDPEGDPEGADKLGDAGKRALDAMKAERNEAKKAQRELQAELEALKAKAEGREKEHEQAQREQQVRDEALSKANERILKSEVRLAAKGVLADPADALLYLDLSEFEVGSDGGVDADALGSAIDDLIKSKPYLAAQGGKRFQGGADGGARKESRPAQLAREDLAGMTADQINQARSEGRLDRLLGVESR